MTAASIVITNHDHGRFVAQAIDSALAQTHAAVEVVVVDDGSTDDSRRIIEGYHDAVRVLFREHGGQARAMLDGFRRSRGEVVLFLDGDDILYPDAVSRISSRFGPRIAKVQGRLDLIDDRGHGLGRQTPPLAMASGDLLPVVLRHGWYPAPPTSGNAFARATLEALLPVPESYAGLWPPTAGSASPTTTCRCSPPFGAVSSPCRSRSAPIVSTRRGAPGNGPPCSRTCGAGSSARRR